ncbi:high mobility group B protein 3-like isoform X1 [Gossypium australe]|uniref:High mobility group B protein 3-like isoform X1 n=1 Tax=Gossypium australe TaxID=47621 RepID=A0A5B6VUV0_9ROSI|nr:high mobility group B protein 3-like isoform X1 [Gossypium australe]
MLQSFVVELKWRITQEPAKESMLPSPAVHRMKENELKRFKGIAGNQNAVKPIISLQHSFMETNKNGNLIDIDLKGFWTWRNMYEEEREPYVTQAGNMNSVYIKGVIEEEKNIIKVTGFRVYEC